MCRSLELRENRGEIKDEISKLADIVNGDNPRTFTDEEEKQWTDLNKRYDAHTASIEAAERAETMDPETAAPVGSGQIPTKSGAKRDTRELWTDQNGKTLRSLRKGDSYVDELRRQNRIGPRDGHNGVSIGHYLRAIAMGPQNEAERRALSEGTDSAGGFTVPSILMGQAVDALRAASQVMRAGASMLALQSDTNSVAKLLTDPVAGWRAENVTLAESDPTFGAITLAPKTLGVQVKVSRELMQDTANLPDMLTTALTGALAAEVDRVVLRGSGTGSEPTGITGIANVNSVDMGTNGAALTNYDPFISAVEAIRTDNVMSDITGAVMHPRDSSVLAKLKDTTNQPLRKPQAIDGLPFGQTTNVSITETHGTATDASRIYLGNWPSVLVGMRSTLRIETSKDIHLDALQVLFVAWLRMDVAVTHAEAMATINGIIP